MEEEVLEKEGLREALVEGLVKVGSLNQRAELHYVQALEVVNPEESQMLSELMGWVGLGEEGEEPSCLTVKQYTRVIMQTQNKK